MTVLVNKDLEGRGRGLINHVPGGNKQRYVETRGIPCMYLTRHEAGIFRIEVRVDLLGYLLVVHLVKKKTYFHKLTSKTERNKQTKEQRIKQ
jgi:hypothetical protein